MERFIRYVKIDTRSDGNSERIPSTPAQLDFVKMLAQELAAMGMDEIRVDEMGFVQATLPSNLNRPVPVVGFLAHVDTANFPSENIAPRIVRDYDGTEILLNEEKNVVLSPTEFENLLEYKGKTLITTDGTTLLGADDKAGVAEIMEAMAYLLSHPEIPHGKVRVSFGPDEEIGRGADNFNAAAFGADFA